MRDADRKLLWSRSGDECAFPGCTQRLTMVPSEAGGGARLTRPVVIGEEAHIVAEEDDGPRGDPSMPIAERNAYPNRMVLCPTHHTLIDKDHGIHFSVDQLLTMKTDHEALVAARRVGGSTQQQNFIRRRQDLLLEAASASGGRLIAGWVAAGVSAELAGVLADDNSVGAPGRLSRALPKTGVVVLEGDFGSGKSVTAERVHAADVSAALADESAPVPVYLLAKYVAGSLVDAVRKAAEGLGDPSNAGLRLVLDGLDEPGPARSAELLGEARSLVFTWPDSRVVVTARPGLKLSRDEELPYPPLSDDEVSVLAERLGGSRHVLWSRSEPIRGMLRLPLFLIVGVLRDQAGVEIPRSQGTFLEALADAALERSHQPTEEARRALKSLARMTVGSGGMIATAELGGDDSVRSVLETRLVVRQGRSLRFALPVVEQYFAAQTVLEAGLEGFDLRDLKLMDRWRDSLTLAVTVGSWQQVSALLDAVAAGHPGLASWLVANAVPRSTVVSSTELPGHVECARRLHHSVAAWVGTLGRLGLQLGLTDGTGRIRTVGAWVAGNRVAAAMKLGENTGTDATQLPYGLHPFTAEAPDGSVWLPYRDGSARADFMAWPWQWSLAWVSAKLEPLLRTMLLPLPDTKPFQDERRWAVAKAVARQTGSIDHRPIEAGGLHTAAEQLIADMESRGSLLLKPLPYRRLIIARDEIIGLVEALTEGTILAADGKLHRPYPAPDLTSGGGHVSSVYSDQALRSLVEQVYANALMIYRDLVNSWFAAFAPTLGLASVLPVALAGQLLPRADGMGGPGFAYRMTPLPLGRMSTSAVSLAAGREDLNADWHLAVEEGQRLRQLVAVLHPGAEGWANPRVTSTTLHVYSDSPATSQAYKWLWADLKSLHMIKSMVPYDMES